METDEHDHSMFALHVESICASTLAFMCIITLNHTQVVHRQSSANQACTGEEAQLCLCTGARAIKS